MAGAWGVIAGPLLWGDAAIKTNPPTAFGGLVWTAAPTLDAGLFAMTARSRDLRERLKFAAKPFDALRLLRVTRKDAKKSLFLAIPTAGKTIFKGALKLEISFSKVEFFPRTKWL